MICVQMECRGWVPAARRAGADACSAGCAVRVHERHGERIRDPGTVEGGNARLRPVQRMQKRELQK